MYKTAQLLCERPESELTILRARGCLRHIDEGAFTRALSSVQRFDVKRLGSKEKTVSSLHIAEAVFYLSPGT